MAGLDRRRFVSILGAGTITLPFVSFSGALFPAVDEANAQLRGGGRMSVEQWMNEWMSVPKAPGGSLHVQRFRDPIYVLLKPISWKPNPGEVPYPEVKVPKGFVTDFASIPRVFWQLLRPDGEYTYPAIIHDYLYWNQSLPRDQADAIFKLAMEDFYVNAAQSTTIYAAVRTGGGSAWNENARLKASGEKRILKRFPQDPRVTWGEWKMEPDVFAR